MLHQILLAGFRMLNGEIFALDELAKECERRGRWALFASSELLNVKGKVASPLNIAAMMQCEQDKGSVGLRMWLKGFRSRTIFANLNRCRISITVFN